MLVNCTIVKYGTNENHIEISILNTWDVSEGEILDRYEPLFDYYLRWKTTNNEECFIKYIHYTKKHNDTIKLEPTHFTLEHNNGTLIDTKMKIIAQIDAVLSFDDVEIFLKGKQIWVTKKYENHIMYYYEL